MAGGRRGEQCSPGGLCGGAGLHGRAMLAPTTRLKPPLCKGRWHGGAVTEGLWPYGGRSIFGQGHNPSVCAIAQPAPFTQGSL